MNLTSHFLHIIKRAWAISACISLLIGGPFLCVKAHAASPTSVMRPPQVVAQTHQDVITTTLQAVQPGTPGTYVTPAINNCKDVDGKGNYSLQIFHQAIPDSYVNQYVEYFDWAGIVHGTHERILRKPGVYSIVCQKVDPTVGWRRSN